jgi:hypothetical protein
MSTATVIQLPQPKQWFHMHLPKTMQTWLIWVGQPHPANLGRQLGTQTQSHTKAGFHCAAESASSNDRILRTTRDWLRQQVTYDDVLVIIQWSTWEREEWLHDGVYYQVGASGIDDVPQALQEKYRNFVIGTDWKKNRTSTQRNLGIPSRASNKVSSIFSSMATMIFHR